MGAFLPVYRDEIRTRELLRKIGRKRVRIYGLLITTDPKHPLSGVIKDRWSEYHHLTGDRFWLVAFDPPAKLSEDFKEYWRRKLGRNFDKVWRAWRKRRGMDPGAAYRHFRLYVRPGSKWPRPPFLVLFTDPDSRRAVVRTLPKWDPESLHELLAGIFEAVVRCCSEPSPAKRLTCLERSLTSPTARGLTLFRHVRARAAEMFLEHPAMVVGTTASFILALANASVLPLAGIPGVMAVLEEIKALRK